jgi:uncharacterized phage protein (TIGR02218 family)
MSRVWFREELETVATFWRVLRTDGVTLGFTSHDHDLWFDGVLHRASPGMVPSSIRRSADFEPDSAEVDGALSHESISAADLAEGRFDSAQVRIGLVDWTSGETRTLYHGAIGAVVDQDGSFTAQLVSRKAELLRDPVPRTSPTCRAQFCGPGCDLPPQGFTHEGTFVAVDPEANSVVVDTLAPAASLAGGTLRWVDGPQAGVAMNITGILEGGLVLDIPVNPTASQGARVILREGCDHTLATCSARFANALNFRGEPFLPGNDLLTRYPVPGQ